MNKALLLTINQIYEKKISIVTPTFNEEQNVEKLCKLISEELNKTNYDYEHIVIDNCSTDNTVKILKKISNENKNLKIIVNTKNFGHIRSPMHGIFQATGDAVILMMSTFRTLRFNFKYIGKWEKVSKSCYGPKRLFPMKTLSNTKLKLFYKIISNLSKEKLLINTTRAGLYDKEIINILKKIDDPYPYFRGLISEITSSVNLIKFHQPKRERGVTKNNFYTLYDIGILGVVKHSKVPLRIMTFTGFLFELCVNNNCSYLFYL